MIPVKYGSGYNAVFLEQVTRAGSPGVLPGGGLPEHGDPHGGSTLFPQPPGNAGSGPEAKLRRFARMRRAGTPEGWDDRAKSASHDERTRGMIEIQPPTAEVAEVLDGVAQRIADELVKRCDRIAWHAERDSTVRRPMRLDLA